MGQRLKPLTRFAVLTAQLKLRPYANTARIRLRQSFEHGTASDLSAAFTAGIGTLISVLLRCKEES